MSRPGGRLWAGSDDDSSASEGENQVEERVQQNRQQKRWDVDSDSGEERQPCIPYQQVILALYEVKLYQ